MLLIKESTLFKKINIDLVIFFKSEDLNGIYIMPRVIIAKIEQLENKWIYLSKVMDALIYVLKRVAKTLWIFINGI